MANTNITYVDQLDVRNSLVNMKVRIIKRWKQLFRLDMILIDERGKKVQAVVKKDLIPQFEDMIMEDTVILLNRCGVAANEDLFPVIKHPLKLSFYKCTEVHKAHSFVGDLYGFNFVPFNEINKALADNKEVMNIDVIGSVIWTSNLDIFKSAKGKETKRFHLKLKDVQGRVVKCTLWGDYAIEFSNFVKTNNSVEHVITIMQHALVKEWSSNITVQTDMFGTRLFINPDIKEAQEFRRSLIVNEGNASTSSALLSETVYPNRLEFLLNTERKYLDEVLQADSTMDCVVLAKIVLLETEWGWFYVGCRKCNKKVLNKQEFLQTVDVENLSDEMVNAPITSLWCPKEKAIATQLVPKFRVTFRVQDSTGTASFLMFDRDVARVVGVSANDIRERQLKSDEIDVYPHELNALIGKKFAFKVSQEPELPEMATAKLADSSQGGISSKDALSVTDESLATELEKDTETSPLVKRTNVTPSVESTTKSPKKIRKLIISPNQDA